MRVVHIPVLLEEVIKNLVSEKTNVFIDATVGAGGHASNILERYKNVKLIGLDADEDILRIAGERLYEFEGRARLIRGNFRDLREILTSEDVASVDGILFDLGLSTFQITGERGFSFNNDSFLDMRMDNRGALTAYDVVNSYDYKELLRIIRDYGEDYRGPAIAKMIIETRKKKPISTAKELGSIVLKAKRRTGRIHPATKTFQAIRIEVNDELKSLQKGIEGAIDMLSPKGRIGVISFHSLEDRITKFAFRDSPALDVITKKPIRPEKIETKENPSSRSAKLRIAEKKQGG
ncbi:MAG: 16S rRNA (cytosine(1402)-N(4))-methyltransferase RsmH [Proteobacteria bacterium]|nr:16S rRNA (cytosine(1402)-N(4))-methyltransferase RsmH [Pseudomonadota bacterium]